MENKTNMQLKAGSVLLWLAIAFLINLVSGYVIVAIVPEQWFPLALLLVELVAFGLPCLIYMRRMDGDVAGDYQQSPATRQSAPYGRSVFLGIISSLFLIGVMSLWQSFIYAKGVDISLITGNVNFGSLFTTMLVAAVAPAVCEELFFRGLLMPSLERYGAGFAVAISGVLFALMHVEIAALPIHLILGLTLSFVAYATRNVFVPMIIHASYNATLILLQYYMSATIPQDVTATQSFLLAPEDAITIIAQTLIYFVLFASVLRSVVASASSVGASPRLARESADVRATEAVAPTGERIPAALIVGIVIMLVVFIAFYVMEFMVLTGGLVNNY
jgi:membrane protease YdiL (CAAX protease family)